MKINLCETHGNDSIYSLAWKEMLDVYHWRGQDLYPYINSFDVFYEIIRLHEDQLRIVTFI